MSRCVTPAPLPWPLAPVGGAALGACGDVVGTGDPALPADVTLALAVPSGGRLTLEEDGRAVQVLGVDVGPNPIAETLPVWPGASITLAEPRTVLRTEQLQVTLVVVLLIVLSVGTGAVVATVTARRLAEPLRDVADRAARLGAGDSAAPRTGTASPSSTASPTCSTPRRARSPSSSSASARSSATSPTSCAAG